MRKDSFIAGQEQANGRDSTRGEIRTLAQAHIAFLEVLEDYERDPL